MFQACSFHIRIFFFENCKWTNKASRRRSFFRAKGSCDRHCTFYLQASFHQIKVNNFSICMINRCKTSYSLLPTIWIVNSHMSCFAFGCIFWDKMRRVLSVWRETLYCLKISCIRNASSGSMKQLNILFTAGYSMDNQRMWNSLW